MRIFNSKLLLILSLAVSGQVFAVPTPDQGFAIGNLLIDAKSGAPYNINENGIYEYHGFTFGTPYQCSGDYFLGTSPGVNNYFWTDTPALDCFLVDSGLDGSITLDHHYTSTLEGNINPGEFLEISSFERNSLAAPISLRFEDFVHWLAEGESLHVTPIILDEGMNELYTGPTVIATAHGIGPEGGNLYTVTLDGIPEDVSNANVMRFLDLAVYIQDGELEKERRIFSSFQLTRANSGTIVNSGYCSELMQFGPASLAAPADIHETFGCTTIIPPGQCKVDTNAAIAASRNYQKTTRKVGSQCADGPTGECNQAVYNQLAAFEVLQESQANLEYTCQ